ncbi:MAG TPA: ROK family transcriptional regulator [Deinococcales bacterium]|nr:ROK family transcriptional regulator [Deinococcales bacterium]
MPTLKGDQGTVRALNRRLILNGIREHGPLSRAQLAELTGLSPAAVTGVTAELIAGRYLVERSVGASSGGRPPILLDLDAVTHRVAGLKLSDERLEAVITDMRTGVLARGSARLQSPTPEQVVTATATLLSTLCAEKNLDLDALLGVGFGLPGVMDERGACLRSPVLGWRDVPIAALLGERLGLPVWVDNDVNALVAAESLFGRGRRADNFIVVTVGRGIGAGFVLGGRVYRGAHGGAAELGHTTVEKNGRPCECGKRGCLEAYAAEPGLVRLYNEAKGHGRARGIKAVVQAAERGDAVALSVLAEAGERLGTAVANLVTLLDPELVVLGGEGVRLGEPYFKPLRRALRETAFGGAGENLPVYVDDWKDEQWARGAASLAVQHTFDFETAGASRAAGGNAAREAGLTPMT